MHIGIDARELLGYTTGIGRYLANLCQEWADSTRAKSHRFTLYFPRNPEAGNQFLPLLSANSDQFRTQVIPGSTGSWWEQVTLPPVVNSAKPDVFFSPAYSAPLRVKCPIVVTIPDVSFVARPEWFRWKEGLRRRYLASRAVSRADRILTISNFSKSEIVNWFNIQPERITVIPLAADDCLASANSPEAPEPLILFVGSIFTRRHLPWLISAFARVLTRTPEARLAVIGSNRTYPFEHLRQLSKGLGIDDRVSIDGWVDDKRLASYYGRARVFAFLSEYEGFGLPPLEALAAGQSLVVLDTEVAREIYGEAAIYAVPGDLDSIANAIITGLNRTPRTVDHIIGRYSWRRTAELTLNVIESTAV